MKPTSWATRAGVIRSRFGRSRTWVKNNTGPAGAAFCAQKLISFRGPYVVSFKDDAATKEFGVMMGIDKQYRVLACIQTVGVILQGAQGATGQWDSKYSPSIVGKKFGSIENGFGSLKKVLVAVHRDDPGNVLLFKSKADSHARVVERARGNFGKWREGKFWEKMVREGLDYHLEHGTTELHSDFARYAKLVSPNGVLSTDGVLAAVEKYGRKAPRGNASSAPASSNDSSCPTSAKAKASGDEGKTPSVGDIQRQAEAIVGRVDLGKPVFFQTSGHVFTSKYSHLEHTFRGVVRDDDLDQAVPVDLTLNESAQFPDPLLLADATRSFGLGMTVLTLGTTHQTYRATDDVMQATVKATVKSTNIAEEMEAAIKEAREEEQRTPRSRRNSRAGARPLKRIGKDGVSAELLMAVVKERLKATNEEEDGDDDNDDDDDDDDDDDVDDDDGNEEDDDEWCEEREGETRKRGRPSTQREEQKEKKRVVGVRAKWTRWTDEERSAFRLGLEKYGRNWEAVAELIPNRTVNQIKAHAQYHLVTKPQRLKQVPGKQCDANKRARLSSREGVGSIGPDQGPAVATGDGARAGAGAGAVSRAVQQSKGKGKPNVSTGSRCNEEEEPENDEAQGPEAEGGPAAGDVPGVGLRAEERVEEDGAVPNVGHAGVPGSDTESDPEVDVDADVDVATVLTEGVGTETDGVIQVEAQPASSEASKRKVEAGNEAGHRLEEESGERPENLYIETGKSAKGTESPACKQSPQALDMLCDERDPAPKN